MDAETFEFVFDTQVELCRSVLFAKRAEYSDGSDCLHNFKTAAALQGVTNREALGGMLAKHVVSIFDLIQKPENVPMEMWNEKIGDAMNYLFLLKACLIEEGADEYDQVLEAMDTHKAPAVSWLAPGIIIGNDAAYTYLEKPDTSGGASRPLMADVDEYELEDEERADRWKRHWKAEVERRDAWHRRDRDRPDSAWDDAY